MTESSSSEAKDSPDKKLSPAEQRKAVLKAMVNAEFDAIERRREHLRGAGKLRAVRKPKAKDEQKGEVGKPPEIETGSNAPILNVTALALSGGGIRSASFSLGVLQALHARGCLPRIDYLSTVSGGGYMGCALTATMTKTQGKFVFGEGAKQGAASRTDVRDTPELGHLRNYSNYLIPFGGRDVITALAIIARGLVANGAIVLGFALFLAALTILGNPKRSELLTPNLFHFPLKDIYFLQWLENIHFGVTLLLALIGFPLFLIWGLYRSAISPPANIAKTGFNFWWRFIAIAFAIFALLFYFGSFRGTDHRIGLIFLAVLLAELVVAWALGKFLALRTKVGYQRGWFVLTAIYAANVAAFVYAARNSAVFIEASVVLLPASFVLLLSARLVGLEKWPPGHLGNETEFRTWLPTGFATYLVVVGLFAVFEFQPYVLAGMFDLFDAANASHDDSHSMLAEFIKWVATVATPVAAVVTFFREQIGTLFKSVTSSSAFTTKLLAVLVSAATWIGGAAVPLLIWLGYLYLCFWGIENDGKPNAQNAPRPRPTIQSTIKIQGPGVDLNASIKCGPGQPDACAQPSGGPSEPAAGFAHSPVWLVKMAEVAAATYSDVAKLIRPNWLDGCSFLCVLSYPLFPFIGPFKEQVPGLYAALAFMLFWLTGWLRPNANSLHQLYRDRLSKAFLFDPKPVNDGKSGVHSKVDPSFPPIGTMGLSELVTSGPYAPYHLINATLNVQGSDYANRRGRNSDFFLFSPLYVGSDATGYVTTQSMQQQAILDIATAMTISGAAFSPNAGAASIVALTPTLALLNVRTGYWLPNPALVSGTLKPPAIPGINFYLWNELTGRLREDREQVYLSDGGHIENLGVYELLRRRCRIIIAVDAEADPSMRFPSFIALQRYARIDLGVRIQMPWDEVRKTTLQWMGYSGDPTAEDKKSQPQKEPKISSGPHVSIGTIDYDGNQQGWMVYIKSSLTGDENDYVRDYARRYDSFPHESTGDQFFSEEQFEVYRALGFHIMARLLNGEDLAQVYDKDLRAVLGNIKADHPNINPVRTALLGRTA